MYRGILCLEKVFSRLCFICLINEEKVIRKNIKQILMLGADEVLKHLKLVVNHPH